MAEPLSPLYFNDAQIRFTAHLPGQAVPKSLLVASVHTDAMHEAAVFAATGRAMAAGPQLLAALKEAVELIRAWHGPVAWEIYRDESPEMRRLSSAVRLAERGFNPASVPVSSRLEQANEHDLRTIAVVDLASLVGTDAFEGSIPDGLDDLIDFLMDESYRVHPSIESLRAQVLSMDVNSRGWLSELGVQLHDHGLLGFAVRFATPEKTQIGEHGWQFSWGITRGTWVYARSYEEAWALGLAWAQRPREGGVA